MSDRYIFDAARWISDAFRAGMFARVNSNGDLALDVVNACPKATEELLGRLSGNSEALILQMPKPESNVHYVNIASASPAAGSYAACVISRRPNGRRPVPVFPLPRTITTASHPP